MRTLARPAPGTAQPVRSTIIGWSPGGNAAAVPWPDAEGRARFFARKAGAGDNWVREDGDAITYRSHLLWLEQKFAKDRVNPESARAVLSGIAEWHDIMVARAVSKTILRRYLQSDAFDNHLPAVREFMQLRAVRPGARFSIDAFRRGLSNHPRWAHGWNEWQRPDYIDHATYFRHINDRNRPALIVTHPYVHSVDRLVELRDAAFADGLDVALLGQNWYAPGTMGLVLTSRNVFARTFREWLRSEENTFPGSRAHWIEHDRAKAGR